MPRCALSGDDPGLLKLLALLELDRKRGAAIENRAVGLAPGQAVRFDRHLGTAGQRYGFRTFAQEL